MSDKVNNVKSEIESGKTSLGIELGSTRIKAVLIDDQHRPIASGNHEWSNTLVDGIWTYSLDEIWNGIQTAYANLKENVIENYGITIKSIGAIGISGMMHGYMVFDKEENLLVPFRTWRNNMTGQASEALTELFEYPIPQRWSIAHLYQAILSKEAHVTEVAFQTTLAGYIHYKLTGEKVIGIGEASGMFPIDLESSDYNSEMINQFNQLLHESGLEWKLENIMPKVLLAGEDAGSLTVEGAKLLDSEHDLCGNIPMCPPEGDAGTGMVATNSVAARTGNVSAGTSVFAMIVLEKDLNKVYSEIDQVTTPSGKLVAMAHSNNCASNLDSWIGIFEEATKALGLEVDKTKLYETLYNKSLEGDADAGGLLSYGYLSGEHITHFEEGRPLFACSSNANFNLANFMRANLFTALGALKIGLDILIKEEKVGLDKILGHGGFFKTKGVGQRYMAAATGAPVTVMETAGEGGAWGIALLAAYRCHKNDSESLDQYLDSKVFMSDDGITIEPDEKDIEGFETFMERYKKGLPIERSAVEYLE